MTHAKHKFRKHTNMRVCHTKTSPTHPVRLISSAIYVIQHYKEPNRSKEKKLGLNEVQFQHLGFISNFPFKNGHKTKII